MTTLPNDNAAMVAMDASQSHEPARASARRPSASGSRSPLITAVEIENFKGISRPVRIDLQPITLLFGRNSAGKSTILHALCYAHEILRHRNADPHKVELGGDQIDLRGFENLVHGHDLERVVRLRFELNLQGWRVPHRLLEKMARPELSESVDPEIAAAHEEWVLSRFRDLGSLARDGWVELKVGGRSGARPTVVHYEVGVNERLFGRIVPGTWGDDLEFNWMHPLFAPLHNDAQDPPSAGRVTEHSDACNGEQLVRAKMITGSTSGLPEWEENIDVDDDDLAKHESVDPDAPANASYARFRALISGVIVGMGQTLRSEAASLRYVGPVRKLRPPTEIEDGATRPASWSDGSAAWSLLARAESAPGDRDLIDEVNHWLRGNDRLDAGCTLRRRTTIELPDHSWVSTIRFVERELGKYRNEAGVIDLDGWIRHEAVAISELVACDAGTIEARLRGVGSEACSDAGAPDPRDSVESELITESRKLYQLFRHSVAEVEKIASGRSPTGIREIVSAIAKARAHSTLQLVTVGSGLPVQTSDVGVGISQLLPVVVAALDPDRPGITAIEQPELHAHPKLQVELGDLFAHAADDGRVFLLENHSEHLMLRLLRRIEETHNGELPEGKPALRPEQVSVVYLDQVDGEIRATQLRIDETGEFIDRWPHGFFEERDDELF